MNQRMVAVASQEVGEFPVGAKLRRLRKEQGLSLQGLANASGVSVGMISQVERGLANPSMRLLTSLRRALNVSMQELFGDVSGEELRPQNDPPYIRRQDSRPVINLGSLRKEILSSAERHSLQIMILTLEKGGETGGRALSYPAEKGGLILKGTIELTVDESTSTLNEGDSFVFDSARPHALRNVCDGPAEILWIIGAMQFDRHL